MQRASVTESDRVRAIAPAVTTTGYYTTPWYRFDRNTNTGGAIADESADQVAVAVNRVPHGPGYPSHLILPVIRRG